MLVGREAAQSLQPIGGVLGVHERLQSGAEPFLRVVMLALDTGVIDRAD